MSRYVLILRNTSGLGPDDISAIMWGDEDVGIYDTHENRFLEKGEKMRKPILCVDFDGVIHLYTSPWTNAETISDGAVPGALRWLWEATKHFDVQVYSSRSKELIGRLAMLSWMINRSYEEFGHDHPMCGPTAGYPITFAHEKPAAFLTIDDRALCFDGDWSKIHPADLLGFKPWNKR